MTSDILWWNSAKRVLEKDLQVFTYYVVCPPFCWNGAEPFLLFASVGSTFWGLSSCPSPVCHWLFQRFAWPMSPPPTPSWARCPCGCKVSPVDCQQLGASHLESQDETGGTRYWLNGKMPREEERFKESRECPCEKKKKKKTKLNYYIIHTNQEKSNRHHDALIDFTTSIFQFQRSSLDGRRSWLHIASPSCCPGDSRDE